MNENVIACVVTYNFDSALLEQNLLSCAKQVNEVVIIDNNSKNKDELNKLILSIPNISIVFNEENYGVAKALNQGLKIATQKQYPFILTMDQDSVLDEHCVTRLYETIEREGFVSVGANYFGKPLKKKYVKKDVLITSGNLVSTEALNQAGGFFDELFVDGVDYDISLKLREQGGKLALVSDAIMTHNLGEPELKKFLFFRMRIIQHSAFRYYYLGRNYKYLAARFKQFRCFRFKEWFQRQKHKLILLLLHDDAREKLKAMKKGKKEYKMLLAKKDETNR